jgi:hypothetical protein
MQGMKEVSLSAPVVDVERESFRAALATIFADSSVPAYDAAAAALLTERVLAFLDTVRDGKED